MGGDHNIAKGMDDGPGSASPMRAQNNYSKLEEGGWGGRRGRGLGHVQYAFSEHWVPRPSIYMDTKR